MVISQGGVVVFVRHGGTYVHVHYKRLRKTDAQQTVLEDMENQQEVTDNKMSGKIILARLRRLLERLWQGSHWPLQMALTMQYLWPHYTCEVN